jgi:hypothetical protein
MELKNKSESGPLVFQKHGTTFEIVQFLENFEKFNLQLLNRRMYHVLLPSIIFRVEFRTKIEIVL